MPRRPRSSSFDSSVSANPDLDTATIDGTPPPLISRRERGGSFHQPAPEGKLPPATAKDVVLPPTLEADPAVETLGPTGGALFRRTISYDSLSELPDQALEAELHKALTTPLTSSQSGEDSALKPLSSHVCPVHTGGPVQALLTGFTPPIEALKPKTGIAANDRAAVKLVTPPSPATDPTLPPSLESEPSGPLSQIKSLLTPDFLEYLRCNSASEPGPIHPVSTAAAPQPAAEPTLPLALESEASDPISAMASLGYDLRDFKATDALIEEIVIDLTGYSSEEYPE